MDELSSRFFVLQRQFVGFSDRLPELIRAWLVKQQVNCLEISVADLSNGILLQDGPQWKHQIARLSLTNKLSFIPFVKCTGSSVAFSNIQATLIAEWPVRAVDMSRLIAETGDTMLEKLQVEQIRRLALIESFGKGQERKNFEQRRMQARIASNELALATEEITRLRNELDSLHSSLTKVNHVHVAHTVYF